VSVCGCNLQVRQRYPVLPPGPFAVLATLCSVFEHALRVVDEFEFYNDQKPLVRREMKEMILLLKGVMARSCGCVVCL
jgi:hypothetical protein